MNNILGVAPGPGRPVHASSTAAIIAPAPDSRTVGIGLFCWSPDREVWR